MSKAIGDYIICIDDDCYLAANVIPETIRILDKYKNLGSIGFGLINPNTSFNKTCFIKKIKLMMKNIISMILMRLKIMLQRKQSKMY